MTYDTINDARTIAGNSEGTILAGRYRVVRQLGQGGMGSVWLVEDTLLDGKPFAVKMLPSIFGSNKRAYAQLKTEALVAMKLTHPNIVTLRAFEENKGNPFLVMDYIDGVTLDEYLLGHTPPPLRGTSPILGEELGGGQKTKDRGSGCMSLRVPQPSSFVSCPLSSVLRHASCNERHVGGTTVDLRHVACRESHVITQPPNHPTTQPPNYPTTE